MIKKFLTVIFIVFIISNTAYAGNSVDSIINTDAPYVILATITNVTDNSIELTRGYGVKYPESANLPDTFSVAKFKYGYCVEHADNYNNPQMGDNIIVAVSYSGGAYNVRSSAFMVDNVSSNAKVKAPESVKNHKCLNELLALGYYIHSDGERTEYEYADDGLVYAVSENGEKFEINRFKEDYVVFYNKSNPAVSNEKLPGKTGIGDSTNAIIIFLAIGVVLGILAIAATNILLDRKEGK